MASRVKTLTLILSHAGERTLQIIMGGKARISKRVLSLKEGGGRG
jgi:hypothetical protein